MDWFRYAALLYAMIVLAQSNESSGDMPSDSSGDMSSDSSGDFDDKSSGFNMSSTSMLPSSITSTPETSSSMVSSTSVAAPEPPSSMVSSTSVAAPEPSSSIISSTSVAAPEPSSSMIPASTSVAAPEPSSSTVSSTSVAAPEPSSSIISSTSVAAPEPSSSMIPASTSVAAPEPSSSMIPASTSVAAPEPSSSMIPASTSVAAPEPSSSIISSTSVAAPEPSSSMIPASTSVAAPEPSSSMVSSTSVTAPEPSSSMIPASTSVAAPEPSSSMVSSTSVAAPEPSSSMIPASTSVAAPEPSSSMIPASTSVAAPEPSSSMIPSTSVAAPEPSSSMVSSTSVAAPEPSSSMIPASTSVAAPEPSSSMIPSTSVAALEPSSSMIPASTSVAAPEPSSSMIPASTSVAAPEPSSSMVSSTSVAAPEPSSSMVSSTSVAAPEPSSSMIPASTSVAAPEPSSSMVSGTSVAAPEPSSSMIPSTSVAAPEPSSSMIPASTSVAAPEPSSSMIPASTSVAAPEPSSSMIPSTSVAAPEPSSSMVSSTSVAAPEPSSSMIPASTSVAAPEPSSSMIPSTSVAAPEPSSSMIPASTSVAAPEPSSSMIPASTSVAAPEPSSSMIPSTSVAAPEPSSSMVSSTSVAAPEPSSSMIPASTSVAAPEPSSSMIPSTSVAAPEPSSSMIPASTSVAAPEPSSSMIPASTSVAAPEPSSSMIPASTSVAAPELSSSMIPASTSVAAPESSSSMVSSTSVAAPEPSSSMIPASTSVAAPEPSSSMIPASTSVAAPEPSSSMVPSTSEAAPEPSSSMIPASTSVASPEPSLSISISLELSSSMIPSTSASPEPSSSMIPSTSVASSEPSSSMIPSTSVAAPESSSLVVVSTSSVEVPEMSSSIIPTPSLTPTATPIPTILPYIYFNRSISTVFNITSRYYWSTFRVNAPRPIPILSNSYPSVFISITGTFSLTGRFYYLYPRLFPSAIRGISNSVVFAPMWNFYDIRREGNLIYQTFSSSNPLANDVFNDVNNFIRVTRDVTSYSGIWMLLMEWKGVHPYPHSFSNDTFLERSNTFQAILTTDGLNTYVIYTYKCGDIMWDSYYRPSTVGYNIPGGRYENHRGSGIPGGLLGLGCSNSMEQRTSYTNIVYSFLSDDEDPNEARCLSLYKNDLQLPTIPSFSSPSCPCTLWQAWFDRRFRFTTYYTVETGYIDCYSNRFPNAYQSMCCYSFGANFGAMIVNEPYFSRIIRYHPVFNRVNYTLFDEDFHASCCIRTQNCHLYRERRPVELCTAYRPPRRAWFWGDPHINTLDGRQYTFNGLGEYVLLRPDSVDFEIQARTKLAAPDTNATVFSAIALSANRDRTEVVQVEISDTDNQQMIVLYNGDNVTTNLTNVNDTLDYNLLSVTRETAEVISIALSTGITVNATLRLGTFTFTLLVPETYMGKTMGLQGNFDNDKTNDFVYRDGTMIPNNSSDAEIYQFGQSWLVQNDTESLFTYPAGQTFANFSNPDHLPIFLDQINASLRAEAEQICGGSNKIECIYDYTQTRNQELARDTQTTIERNEEDRRIGDNLPPVIEASDTFTVTVGVASLYTLNITDPGDTFNVTINGQFPLTLSQDGSIWTINVTLPSLIRNLTFSVIATDSLNAISAVTPQVRICGCSPDKGNCTADGVQNASSNPLLLICECNEAYSGEYCEDDADGCLEVSCFNDAECEDEIAPKTGATCPSCPTGYTGDGLVCNDVDECRFPSDNNCSQFCNNTLGGFQCTCMPGYELESDGRTCSEIDECQRLLDNCQQECINTDGSFNCSCRDGFILQADGRTCEVDPDRECLDADRCEQFCIRNNATGVENCSCSSGFVLASNSENCTNVDECSEGTSPCTQNCTDTVGGFECSCRDGFQLQSDRFTCRDTDECLSISSCPEPRIRCVNTEGSFDCFCPLGTVFENGSCNVEPVPSSPSPSPTPSASPTPSVTPTPPANSGVIIVLSGTNRSSFDEERFKNVTAEAINDYCASNTCNNIDARRKRQSPIMIEPDDIVITNIIETNNGLSVTFYVRGQSGAPISANDIVAAVQAADRRYSDAGFMISSVTQLDPPPSTTTTPTEDDGGLSGGEIAGIVIGVVVGTLLIIIIIIIIVFCLCRKLKGTGRYAFVEKGMTVAVKDDDFTVQNVYYEPSPPSPEGSVHSMKLKFVQESESSDDEDGGDEGKKVKKRGSRAGSLDGRLEKEMIEMSEETHL